MSDDLRLLADDTGARDTALDVSRSFIVQAPAGSGKTELLIQRYLALLPRVKNPEEVLAITFTRKAAMEMKQRVTTALMHARDAIDAMTAHGQFTLSLAAKVLAQDQAEGWNLIDSPGRMKIETVDAFGAGIARSLPFSSGLGGASATLADADSIAIYRDAAAATLDYLTIGNAAGTAAERVLLHLDNNVSLYITYVARMLASREQWLAITGAGFSGTEEADAARRQLESNIANVIARQLASLEAQLPQAYYNDLLVMLRYAATNLVGAGKSDHSLARLVLVDIQLLPTCTATERGTWQAIADLLLTKQGGWRKRVNKNDGFPVGDSGQKQMLYDLVSSLSAHSAGSHLLREGLHRTRLLPAAEYSDEQWSVLLALFQLLPLAVGELRRLFGERAVSDHNEVALSAGRALGSADEPGDIALILDYQIRHLLIDEMQDTSFGQYELIKRLVAGWAPDDGRTVFCVGDPMQSIYRFRDAEVGEFLLARKNGIGNVHLEPLLLRRNFRSGENLVHWFNTVFQQVMPLHDDVAIGAIAYSDSVPVEQHANSGEHVVHPLFAVDSAAEAQHTLRVIQQCIDAPDKGSIAVLVRSRTQLAALLVQLRQAGVEYQAVEIDRLTDLPEIIDVLALTRALCHEGDRLAWLALLRSPWVGLTWKDLHALVVNDVDMTVMELCRDPARCENLSEDGRLRLHSFLTDIAPFRKRAATLTLRRRVELAWCALGGPALLDDAEQIENVYRYLAVLDKIETAGTLDDVRELEQKLDGERVSSMVSAACRLQLMTMHKAKGLQFDHVVMPGLGRATRGSDRDVLSWLSTSVESGHKELIISPVGSRAAVENDQLHQFIEATAKDKERMELDRLLYVACTRAVKSLHLIGSVTVAPDGESFRPPVRGSLLARLWTAIECDYTEAFDKRSADESIEALPVVDEYLVKPVLRRFEDRWQPPEPAGHAAFSVQAHDDPLPADQAVEFYWVGSAARHAGTIVHRWLQRISDGNYAIDKRDAGLEQAMTRRWAKALGVMEDDVEDVWARTSTALDNILADAKGRWVLSGEGHAELALTGLYSGRPESIVIDRVRIDEHGVHWIVDYKTSTHEGGDLAGFLRQESDRYRPQLRRYAELYANLTGAVVKTALYFPLLQEFCEVSLANNV